MNSKLVNTEYLTHASEQIEIIKAECALRYNISVQQLEMKTRKREIVDARHFAMFFSHKYFYPKITLASIGILVAGKDHATVLHNKKKIENLIDSNLEIRSAYNDLDEILSRKITTELPKPEINKYPVNGRIEFTYDEDDEIKKRVVIYDGAATTLTINKGGVIEIITGVEALKKFKMIVLSINI